MKKIVACFSFLCLIGCGNSDTKEKSNADSVRNTVKDPEYEKGLDLIAKSDCFTCHKVSETSIGPSYSAIADKYKRIDDASMDSMVTQIIKGGKGRWGNIPMTAHPTVSKEDAKSMVHYIMSTNK